MYMFYVNHIIGVFNQQIHVNFVKFEVILIFMYLLIAFCLNFSGTYFTHIQDDAVFNDFKSLGCIISSKF